MNKNDAAKALGISLRSLERRMRNGRVKFTKSGDGSFSEVSFTYADLGLPEPQTAPLAVDSSPDPPPSDPTAPAETDSALGNDLENWPSEELEAGRLQWMKPDNPKGFPTNAPCVGSSTMPSPENYARFTRANAILADRRLRVVGLSGLPRQRRTAYNAAQLPRF